jgi:hypothetical protein
LHQGGKWGVFHSSVMDVSNQNNLSPPDIEELYIKETTVSIEHTEEQSQQLTEPMLVDELKSFVEVWKMAVKQQNVTFLKIYDGNFPFHVSATIKDSAEIGTHQTIKNSNWS